MCYPSIKPSKLANIGTQNEREQTNFNAQDTTWPSSNQYTTLCET